MNKWHISSIIILAAILAIILWQEPPSLLLDLSDKNSLSKKQHPDSYLTHSLTTQYNLQGIVANIITADRTDYYESNRDNPHNYALLKQPKIIIYDNKPPKNQPWHASSNHARSTNNNEEFLLSGDVVLTQKTSDQKSATTITSEQLLIKPNQKYAETNKPVMIKTPSGVTSSVGLKMSLDKETIELLSNVRSRYESN